MVPNMRWTGMSDGEHESEWLIERWARKGGFEPKKTKNQAVEAQFPQTNCLYLTVPHGFPWSPHGVLIVLMESSWSPHGVFIVS